MEYNLLFRRERVKFSAKSVDVSVYYCSAPSCRAFEKRVLRKVCDTAMPALLISASASDAKGAVSYSGVTSLDGIFQAAWCYPAYHLCYRVCPL